VPWLQKPFGAGGDSGELHDTTPWVSSLEGSACFADAQGEAERAAKLLGAVEVR
jgi:hypothetical protein